MDGKIGLEEHFALEETLGDSQKFTAEATWQELRANAPKLFGINSHYK